MSRGKPVEHDVEQMSDEWFHLRAGKATASRFSSIVTDAFKLRTSVGVRKLAGELAAERVVGGVLSMAWDGDGRAAGRGVGLEDLARNWYQFHKGVRVRQVGFIETADGRAGCSPDGLVDDDPEGPGGLEIKNPMTRAHAFNLLGLEGVASPGQVQGSLWVTGRKWWDVISWTLEPRLGPVLVRMRPVDVLQRSLGKALGEFEVLVEQYREQLEVMGKAGRVDEGSELRLQLLASLRHGVDPNPDNLSLQEVSDFADDVRRARRLAILDEAAAASYIASAESGDPSATRDAWASLREALAAVEGTT